MRFEIRLVAGVGTLLMGVALFASGCAPGEDDKRGFPQKRDSQKVATGTTSSAAQSPGDGGPLGANNSALPPGVGPQNPLVPKPGEPGIRIQVAADQPPATNEAVRIGGDSKQGSCAGQKQATQELFVEASDGLNMRSTPDAQGHLLGALSTGTSVKVWSEVTSSSGQVWVCVSAQSSGGQNLTGWLSKAHLRSE